MQESYEITKEIQNIINEVLDHSKAKSIKINALAGTGKTRLIQILSETLTANRQMKVLYLAYSNRLIEEAKASFAPNLNLDIMSVFNLAEKYVTEFEYMNREYNHFEIAKLLNIDIFTAEQVRDFLSVVLKSSNPNMLSDINSCDTQSIISGCVIDCVRELISDINAKYIKATPKFLVKKLLDKILRNDNKFIKYDYLFVDEGQDLSDAATVIFENYPTTKRIIVGDINQKIYKYANNEILLTSSEAKKFPLNKSYRHHQNIIKKANFILKTFKGNSEIITPLCDYNSSYEIKNIGLISQYKIGILDSIDYLLGKGINEFYIKEDPLNIFLSLGTLLQIPLFANDKRVKERNQYINNLKIEWEKEKKYYNNLSFLKYLEKIIPKEKYTLLVDIKYAMKYEHSLLNMYKITKKNYLSNKKNKFKYKIGTIYQFKGFEFDKVILMENFQDICYRIAYFFVAVEKHKKARKNFNYIAEFTNYISKKEKVEKNYSQYKWIHEINLYYTAITRAKYEFEDFSINRKYVSDEIINFEIGKKISLVLQNRSN